jgi:ubiquinol-cytochrome c reductase iron-sulfur subunit
MATTERTSARAEEWRRRREAEDRAARWAAVCFVVSILAAVALFFVYIAGGQTQAEGVLIAVAFSGVGLGLAIWVKRVIGHREVVEERYPMRSPDDSRDQFEAAYEEALGEATVGGRRRFLLRLLAGAGASLGLALLIPLRSLGPSPEGEMFSTSWAEGVRLVDAGGREYRPEDIDPDAVVTVFPQNDVGSPQAQAILVGTRPDELDPDSLPGPTVDNLVCYSKICTHAGCPVGLYRAAAGELLCPCHQSTFDVNAGARVLSGPAGRGLPHLPLGVDDEGFLVALGDFNEPVGPSFWNLTHEPPQA